MAGDLTEADLIGLRTVRDGGAISPSRINRLCDLELIGFESRLTLKGTTVTKTERAWLKAAGRRALLESDGGGDA